MFYMERIEALEKEVTYLKEQIKKDGFEINKTIDNMNRFFIALLSYLKISVEKVREVGTNDYGVEKIVTNYKFSKKSK